MGVQPHSLSVGEPFDAVHLLDEERLLVLVHHAVGRSHGCTEFKGDESRRVGLGRARDRYPGLPEQDGWRATADGTTTEAHVRLDAEPVAVEDLGEGHRVAALDIILACGLKPEVQQRYAVGDRGVVLAEDRYRVIDQRLCRRLCWRSGKEGRGKHSRCVHRPDLLGMARRPSHVGSQLGFDLVIDVGEESRRGGRQEDVGGVVDRELEGRRQTRVRGSVLECQSAPARLCDEAVGEALGEAVPPQPCELVGEAPRGVAARQVGVVPGPSERPLGVDRLAAEGPAAELDLELIGDRLVVEGW